MSTPVVRFDDAKPRRIRVTSGTAVSRVSALVGLAAVVVLAFAPSYADAGLLSRLGDMFGLLALAQMWNLLAGYAGLVSIGQQGFFGLGAYALIAFVNNQGLNLYLSVLLAGLVVGLIAIPTSFLAFRLRGAYFAIGTWVIAQVFLEVISNNAALGGGSGVTLRVIGTDLRTRQHVTYWIALAVGVGSVMVVYAMLRSRLGLALQSIRDNEDGARGIGVDVFRNQLLVFLIAALWTGLAGAVYYLSHLRVQPTAAFSVISWTAPIIFIVVIGGLGTVEGPIIGTVVYYVLSRRFENDQTWYFIGLGLAAILVSLYFRRGLWGEVQARTGVHLFPVRRRLRIDDET